jgi:iron complex transport system permease protein
MGRGQVAARRTTWLVVVAAAVVAAAALSLLVGSRTTSPAEVWQALFHPVGVETDHIVRSMRIPRTVVGILAGAALGAAGVLMQGVTRNPIAEPGILGISMGAAAGVVFALTVLGLSSLTAYIWLGCLGAALTTLVVYGVASSGRGGATPTKLVLAGAALTALLAGVIAAILILDYRTMDAYRFWVVGSLAGMESSTALQLIPFVGAGLLLALTCARGLDAIALGDDVAAGLGQNVARTRILAATAMTVLIGAAVAATGPIAFVGLMVPHAARALVGTGHRVLLACSALLGPVVLLGADIMGRVITSPAEVHAGVITALLGAPILIALVQRRKVVAV